MRQAIIHIAATLCVANFSVPAQDSKPKAPATPAKAASSQDATEPTAPTDAPTVAIAVQRGVEILLASQENYVPDRPVGTLPDDRLAAWQDKESARLEKLRATDEPKHEWPYEGVYRVRPGVIPAGYRVGGSAIVCEALLVAPRLTADKARKTAIERSVRFMLDELTENAELAAGPKTGYDVRGWGHTYALRLFLRILRSKLVDADLAKEIDAMIPHLLHCIATNEAKAGGGWNYANDSCSPFMTGSTLLTLYHARAMGYEVDSAMVERALDGLEAARTESGSYAYAGAVRKGGKVAMAGACARAAIAELSLYLAGRSDHDRLRVAVEAFFEHWGELLVRKSQQGTHVGEFGIAPYYFMYGHTYVAMAIEALPLEERDALRARLRDTLWKTREADGGWNDRIFPRSKSYSTAMALLALSAPEMDAIPAWPTEAK